MSTIIANDLWVCTDCAMMLANGELGQGDRNAEIAHAQRMNEELAGWLQEGGPYVQMVLSGEEDDDSRFSWSRCDGCGSTLGGDRERAAVLSS